MRTRQEQLLSRRVQIENRLAEKKVDVIDTKTILRYSAEMREIIESGSLTHRKAFIHGFVKDINVTGDKAVMTYTMPELPDKVELDIGGVPLTVTHGGQSRTIGRTFVLTFYFATGLHKTISNEPE